MIMRLLFAPGLPTLIAGLIFTLWGAAMLFLGFQWGKTWGLNHQADIWRRELDQRAFKAAQQEERLAAERRLTRRLTVIISQLTPRGTDSIRLTEPEIEPQSERKVFPWPKQKNLNL